MKIHSNPFLTFYISYTILLTLPQNPSHYCGKVMGLVFLSLNVSFVTTALDKLVVLLQKSERERSFKQVLKILGRSIQKNAHPQEKKGTNNVTLEALINSNLNQKNEREILVPSMYMYLYSTQFLVESRIQAEKICIY